MERRVRIIPSIASADPINIMAEISRIREWELLHIDIEDGNFLPNITFGPKTVRAIAKYTEQQLDGHILANDPVRFLPLFHECGFTRAAAHLEALPYPLVFLNRARAMGMKAGLALNFSSPAEAVSLFAAQTDYVIVMTSEPDGLDESFYPPILRKIKRMREILPPETEIWADGGINDQNMHLVKAAGADTMIMGRRIFKSGEPLTTLRPLQDELNRIPSVGV